MPNGYAETAALLRDRLGLDLPPVAVALVAEPPAGLPRDQSPSPSACTFWRRAEQSTFYASAEDHFHCPIGAMVMGFNLSEEKGSELMGLVGQMCSISYIEESEVPHIPKFEKSSNGAVYGPLAEFPLDVDVALVWATPQQAMILQEALGNATWSENPGGVVLGRPACGVLPSAQKSGQTTISLGCAGMRTYTEILPDRMLIAIPGAHLGEVADKLQRITGANDQMGAFYRERKAAVQALS